MYSEHFTEDGAEVEITTKLKVFHTKKKNHDFTPDYEDFDSVISAIEGELQNIKKMLKRHVKITYDFEGWLETNYWGRILQYYYLSKISPGDRNLIKYVLDIIGVKEDIRKVCKITIVKREPLPA